MPKAKYSISVLAQVFFTTLATVTSVVANAAELINDNKQFTLLGQHQAGMRTRFQQVDDPWLGDAQALTMRLKLTSRFLFDEEEKWQALIEPNMVLAVNEQDYNSVTIKRRSSPIPDPDGFNLSKAFIVYQSDNNWQVTLGRQALSFDSERMIGAIEFWQTPQNFDALKFHFNDQIKWNFQYAYSNKVHRIFGRDAKSTIPEEDIRFGFISKRPVNELGQHELNSHKFNVAYKTDNDLKATVYSYLLENKTQKKFSSNTFGVRISDEFKPNKLKYRYTTEFAVQEGAYNNDDNYKAWYSLLEASIQYKSHIFQLSQEILSEDEGSSFKTSLGTNHKFQGWADVFTGYSMQAGLRDQYFTYRGRERKLRWRSVFHYFKGYSNSADIGYELDLELAYRLTRKWQFKLIFADYHSKDGLRHFPKTNYDLSTWFVSVAYNI